jgi:hypothetical protein
VHVIVGSEYIGTSSLLIIMFGPTTDGVITSHYNFALELELYSYNLYVFYACALSIGK